MKSRFFGLRTKVCVCLLSLQLTNSCSHIPSSVTPVIQPSANETKPLWLRFLSQLSIPTGASPSGVKLKSPFGGISAASPFAIQKAAFRLMLLSDDRSSEGPARAYEAIVGFDPKGNPKLQINKEIELKKSDGPLFEKGTIDPEGLYISPHGKIFLSQEGSLTGLNVWHPPSIFELTDVGQSLDQMQIPNYVMPDADPTSASADKNNPLQKIGQRYNLSFEGLSGAQNWLFAALEGPLVQDSGLATFDNAAVTRLFKYDLQNNSKGPVAAFFYPVESVRKYESYPDGVKADVNGVSDILFWNENSGLVLERGGVGFPDKSYETQVFLYQIDLKNAENILNCQSKVTNCLDSKPVSKKLVLDFGTLKSQLVPAFSSIDNLEAMFFGPLSPSGARTLWVISDNNFSQSQRTQILVFEIL